MFNKPHDECGVFGIFNNNSLDTVQETYLGLFALQHRGQISCGIAVNNNGEFTSHKELGLVPEVFTSQVLQKLSENGKGDIAIGHVRYSPSKSSEFANTQPLVMRYVKGNLALASNGSLINTAELRKELELDGAIFQTSGYLEIIAYLIARIRLKTGSIEQALNEVMKKLSGAFSLVMMSPKKLIAARDPHGFRPLCIGKIENSYVFASESCAIDSIGAEFVRDVEPGEIVIADKNGLRSIRDNCAGKTSLCIFEHVYFSRPDSVIDGASVSTSRQRAGAFLAKEHPVDADLVVGVPDSGIDAAVGYANESGIPYGMGFIKNRYIGRTFIQSSQAEREKSVHIKLNPLAAAVDGKRVVLIDDSIIRGTTSARIVKLLRSAGATEVHMRVSSPPFLYPCYFGTDISSQDYLIACRLSEEEIRKQIGADSLGYLSLESLHKIAAESKTDFCDGCFSGNYPIEVQQEESADKYRRKLKTLL